MRSRILYVEGDEATRQIIADAFSEYEITTAHSIREAWSFIASRSYSLIIMDSELRDGTGVDLCRTIRAVDPATPILFYSDGFHHTSRGAALAAGAQQYLVKPSSVEELTLIGDCLLNDSHV